MPKTKYVKIRELMIMNKCIDEVNVLSNEVNKERGGSLITEFIKQIHRHSTECITMMIIFHLQCICNIISGFFRETRFLSKSRCFEVTFHDK